ncbi:MAG TPA: hypothetical protein VF043_19375 [Ktedonobacteraceae bacterium]
MQRSHCRTVSLVLIYVGLIIGLQFLLQGVIDGGNEMVIVAGSPSLRGITGRPTPITCPPITCPPDRVRVAINLAPTPLP